MLRRSILGDFWEHPEPGVPIPNSITAGNPDITVSTGANFGIGLRATWVNEDIFGSRRHEAYFDAMAGRAFQLGHAWVIEFEWSRQEDLGMFVAGAVACALAEGSEGFIMSWEPVVARLKALYGELDERDFIPVEPTYSRTELSGAVISQLSRANLKPEALDSQVREMQVAVDRLEFPEETTCPGLEELASALVRMLATESDIAGRSLLLHCAAINAAVEFLATRPRPSTPPRVGADRRRRLGGARR